MKETLIPPPTSRYCSRSEWKAEPTLSVAEALQEAMQTDQKPLPPPPPPSISPPHSLPEAHLPLRKASVKKLHQQQQAQVIRAAAPTPIWTPDTQHQLRGFSPSPVQALPQPRIVDVQASSEHAFAGREGREKKAFKPPLALGAQAMRHGLQQENVPRRQEMERPRTNSEVDSRPPSSPLLPPPPSPHMKQPKRLRSSKSVGEGLKAWRNRFSAPNKGTPPVDRDTIYSVPVMRPSMASIMPPNGIRDSYRSAVTSHSSSLLQTSSINTEHSSLTGDSSQSDLVTGLSNWPETECETDGEMDEEEGGMSVEDAIEMYVDGFESAKPSMDTQGKRSFQTSRPTSQPSGANSPSQKAKRLNYAHRRSQSASLIDRANYIPPQDQNPNPEPKTLLAPPSNTNLADHKRTFTRILSAPLTTTQLASSPIPRDRYGFKKTNHYITLAAYDAWNTPYTAHLIRRRRKWNTLMNSYGLSTTPAYRFPPKSDKVKRYVRKGIPPEYRGAAWFWYAGGPGKMAKQPGLYLKVLERVKGGELREQDRELIERDLQRTFPDNVRFKPDPSDMVDAQSGAGGGGNDINGSAAKTTKKKSARYSVEPETPILQSLRRVLQAFAVHNPSVGYCQSLNFIAGLLLLFLDEDEEKAFILLNIVTTDHLPGTHGVALEGANVDIAVLMSCVKDSLPQVWSRLDDTSTTGGVRGTAAGTTGGGAHQALPRLPTVSLATTAWFMSLFVGTLPIESVVRVWDCLFFEGSKTLFRIALAIFKFSAPQILSEKLTDSMEIFQLVQQLPRGLVDVNALMGVAFKRGRGGFGNVSQGVIEERREERRQCVRDGMSTFEGGGKGWRARWRGRTGTGRIGTGL